MLPVDCPTFPCQTSATDCPDSAFGMVRVLPAVNFGTRVEWTLRDEIRLRHPVTAWLEISPHGLAQAPGWQTVSGPLEEAAYLIDPLQRDFGVTPQTHYRVVLEDAQGRVLKSPPASALGALDHRSWRLLQVLIRDEVRRMRTQPGGVPIWLLKRKRSGALCTHCVDPQSQEVLQPHCHHCYGVGFSGGYFQPQECGWAEPLQGRGSFERQDIQALGPIDEEGSLRAVRMVASPRLDCRDVVIFAHSGERFEVINWKAGAELRSVPVVYAPVTLRLLPRSHPIYTFQVIQQISLIYG